MNLHWTDRSRCAFWPKHILSFNLGIYVEDEIAPIGIGSICKGPNKISVSAWLSMSFLLWSDVLLWIKAVSERPSLLATEYR